ncbi:heavy metal translocating P-type ATPase [Marinomonas aquiplantarum]|uniref:Copper-exporting P-type ATPase n=1 Tax=Marinomonas aquiplantarum TaxID=491951 RepID=A0A366CTJ5_9GAMM|nr:heavy metal translocating P-type ATPase [Marinomonas aquiplantarum]RBO79620.1 Cu+-exporting ATPase [Marinomonas aquiplantarum]
MTDVNKDKVSLSVYGMSCQGCVRKIREQIQLKSPNADVIGEPKANRLDVLSDLNLTQIQDAVEQAGFAISANKLNQEINPSSSSNDAELDKPSSEGKTKQAVDYQIAISGMTCAGCVNTVQSAIAKVDGTIKVEVNFASHLAQVTSSARYQELLTAISDVGYQGELVTDAQQNAENKIAKDANEYRQKITSSFMGLSFGVPLMLYGLLGGSMKVSSLTEQFVWLLIGSVCALIMYFAGKHYFISAWKAVRSHHANMDLLIAIGTGSAWLYSMFVVLFPDFLPANTRHLYFEAAVMIIGLINLGQALEVKARSKTNQALQKLLDLAPKQAILVRDGQDVQVPVANVNVGDLLRLRSGDAVPVDGDVIEGQSYLNEAMLTGESVPVRKAVGDSVKAGTINTNGSLVIKVLKTGKQTQLAKIVDMVSRAQNSKPPISHLADKVSAIFVPSVIIIAILTALAWFNFANAHDYSYMLVTAVSVLIIACPCALGLATPISTMIGVGKAAEMGGLIRNGEALQVASNIDCLVFDKTGTITQGKPSVTKVDYFDERAQTELINPLVKALESKVSHPLAQALLEYIDQQDSKQTTDKTSVDHIALSEYENLPGLGVRGRFKNDWYYLGNEKLLSQAGLSVPSSINTEEAGSHVYLFSSDALLSHYLLQDPIQESAANALKNLKSMGIKLIMLTGDQKVNASQVAAQLNIDEYHAELMPEDKLKWIKSLQRNGNIVGMIGDGINDAPALAQANVGFAMGEGTDVAMESADVTLLHNNLNALVDVISVSKATIRNIKQNLWGAFTYNSLGIPVAAGLLYPITGWLLSPIIAGVAMSLSSVTVVLNANRLRRVIKQQLKEVERAH